MTPTLCTAAHDQPRMALGGLQVCAWHVKKTTVAISLMPALHEMLSGYLTLAGGGTAGEFIRSSPTPGLNLDPNVATARTDLLNHLHCWARIGAEEGPWDTWPADEPAAIARWLLVRLDWYLSQSWAGEFARESIDLHRMALYLRQPQAVKRFTVGPCPEPDCTGTLITEIRPADDLLPSRIWCDLAPIDPETGEQIHIWTPDRWLLLGRQVDRKKEAG